jgi:hypothetical protein
MSTGNVCANGHHNAVPNGITANTLLSSIKEARERKGEESASNANEA